MRTLRTTGSERGSIVQGALISILTVVLLLAVIEISLRLSGTGPDGDEDHPVEDPVDLRQHSLVHRRSRIPGLFYELNPGTFTVTRGIRNEINSHGMRDREVPLEKPEGTYRIAVLGDSFTYGWGVELEDTYLKRLEAILNERSGGDLRYETLNFGVSGYNTEQEVILLRERVLPFEPDLVLIGFVTNDILLPASPLARYLAGSDPVFVRIARKAGELRDRYNPREAADVLPPWLRWSKTASTVWQRIENTRKGDFLVNYYGNEERWRALVGAFRAAKRLTEERGIGLSVVLFPSDLRILSEHPRSRVHEQVRGALDEMGIVSVDLLDAYREAETERIILDPGDPHPGPYGHLLAARRIAEELAGSGLLPEDAARTGTGGW